MIEIKFTKRLETALKAFCEANGMTVEEYVQKTVEEKFNLDRYGDMNLLLKKEEPKKKRTTRKKAEKPAEPEVKEEPVKEPEPVIAETADEEAKEVEEPKPVKRRRRTLTVK